MSLSNLLYGNDFNIHCKTLTASDGLTLTHDSGSHSLTANREGLLLNGAPLEAQPAQPGNQWEAVVDGTGQQQDLLSTLEVQAGSVGKLSFLLLASSGNSTTAKEGHFIYRHDVNGLVLLTPRNVRVFVEELVIPQLSWLVDAEGRFQAQTTLPVGARVSLSGKITSI